MEISLLHFVLHFSVIALFAVLLLKAIATPTAKLKYVQYLAVAVCFLFLIAMLRQAVKFDLKTIFIAPIIPPKKQMLWLVINPIFGYFVNFSINKTK